jgi:hypothetical protein
LGIDVSPEAVTLWLKQLAQLGRACLELAKSDKGSAIRQRMGPGIQP